MSYGTQSILPSPPGQMYPGGNPGGPLMGTPAPQGGPGVMTNPLVPAGGQGGGASAGGLTPQQMQQIQADIAKASQGVSGQGETFGSLEQALQSQLGSQFSPQQVQQIMGWVGGAQGTSTGNPGQGPAGSQYGLNAGSMLRGNPQDAQNSLDAAVQSGQQGSQATNQMYGNMSPYTPLPYQAFGAIPQITPAQVQPGDIGGYLPGYESAVAQASAPYFQQQSENLNSDLASRGIYNSGAANAAQGNLLAQQYGTVLGQSLPMAQQDITGNIGAQNQALGANAAAYGNVTQGNQNLYNNYLSQLFGGNQQRANTLQDAYLQSFQPYAGLIGQGLGQAGNAYQTAYGQGIQGAGQLGGALGGLASSYFQPGGSASATGAFGGGSAPTADFSGMPQSFG